MNQLIFKSNAKPKGLIGKSSGIIALFFILILFPSHTVNYTLNQTDALAPKTKEIIVVKNAEIPRSEKEALLILPGLGDKKKRRKRQYEYFGKTEYDLFIPSYIDRKSYTGTVEKFTRFFEEKKLGEYKKVHVFSYVLGSWVINTFINKNGQQNISTIVYDRSPLQERAPQVAVDRIPCITKLVAGNIIKEFAKVKYPPIPKGDIKIGIIVECKATKLIRMFRKTAMSYGPINWKNLDFKQGHDDMIYTHLDHDEMYFSFDEIGGDITHFVKHGIFTKEARREAFDWDPFEKYKD